MTLPAGIELDNLEFAVEGDNLVLVLADGTEIIVLGGAANIPTFVIGDVELPQVALFAALEGSNINVAAGPDGTFSAQGGPTASRNFNDDPIDAGPEDLALADLLGDTAFGDELRTGVILGAEGDTEPTFLGADSGGVDEDYLKNGNLNDGGNGGSSVTGSLGINWGADDDNVLGNTGLTNSNDRGIAFTQTTLDALASQGYTSDGVSLVYGLSANGTTLTAFKGNGEGGFGEEVFVVSVSDVATNGSYTFELRGNLDHPDGSTEDNISIAFPFTAQDSDGDRGSSSFTVTVNDDSPVIKIPTYENGAPIYGVVEEEQREVLGYGNEDTDGEYDNDYYNRGSNEQRSFGDRLGKGWFVDETTNEAKGSLGISWGADDSDDESIIVGSGNRSVSFAEFEAPEGLFSAGIQVEYSLSDDGTALTATAGEATVFTVTLSDDESGSYTFTLLRPLDHPDGAGENSLKLDFQFTATDSDGDTTGPATISVIVVDDVPILSGCDLVATIDEDDIATIGKAFPGESLGTSPNDGNRDGSYTNSPANNQPGPAFISGSLAHLVKAGADGPLAFSFIDGDEAREMLEKLGLSSKGAELSYEVRDGVLYAFDNAGDDKGVSYDPQFGDRLVFELTLDSNGSYEFRLYDQLDHDAPGDDRWGRPTNSDENFDLEDGLGYRDVTAIDFGAIIKATDNDEDSVSLEDAFSIRVRDDVPELSGKEENRLVDEDDIKNDQSTGNFPNDGSGDGSLTGSANSNGNGPAVISGSLAGLVKGGADDTIKFSFIREDSARAALEKLGLKSEGAELSYDIRDGVLYAFDNAGPHKGESYDSDKGDRLVFKLTLSETGSYTFELVDQLDHDLGGGQNTDLQDGLKYSDVEAIDFGSVIKATDYDGDSVVLKDAFSITIKDDAPVLSGQKENRIVDEDDISTLNDGLIGGSLGTSPNDDEDDDSFTGSPNNNQLGPAFISGSLANLVRGGADDPIKFSFIDEATVIRTLANLGLSSKGEELSYDIQGNVLYGFDNDAGNSSYGNGDRPVFKLTLSEDGSYTFELLDQLDHDKPASGADENYDLQGDIRGDVTAINFGALIKATDNDGDSVSLDGAFSIKVRDDVPTAVARNTSETLVVDETSGQQNDDVPDPLSMFQYVGVKGYDPNMSAQFAQQASFVTSTINGGADDGVKIDWDLKINGGNGTDSGLFTTDGRAILLFLEDGLIVGRYDKPNDGNTTVNSSDPAAFALQLSDDGTLSMVQYVSIKHDDPTDHDENNDANDNNLSTAVQSLAGKINAVLTVTDYDGDKAVSEVAVGDRIQFHDDGPSVSCEAIAFTVDEDGLLGATIDTAQPGEVAGSGSTLYTGGVNALKALFDFGADGAHATQAISLKETAEPVKTDFKSQGGDVLIKVVGNVLTGYVAGTDGAEDRPVFILTVNADGSYTFELKDQIDHSNPDGNTETYLEDGIDLSAYIVGKDGDGDTVTLTDGKFVVNVLDDIPAATGEPVNVKVDAPQIVEPVEGKVANFVLVLDTSGSVNVQQFQTQVKEFLDNLADTDAKDVRVHIVEFNSGAKPVGTYDLIVNGETNADALEKALDDIEDLNDGGNTNYEAGLQEALAWIEGIEPSTINVGSVQYIDPNGSQDDDRALILSGSGEQLALVSGWWQNGTELVNANIDNNGRIGVSSGNNLAITNSEVLRFDFGQFTDFDGNGVFTDRGAFVGVDVTSTSFRLSDLVNGNTSTTFRYTVHLTDGTSAPVIVQVNGSQNITVSAPAGKMIDYVEFTVTSGEGQVQLGSVTTAPDGPLANADVNELIFLSDGEPNRNETEWWDTSAREALEQIKDEIAKIESGASGPAFTIQAWGIKPSGNNLNNLDKVEGQGGDAEDLADGTLSDKYAAIFAAIGGATGSTQPAEANFDVSALISSGADEALAFSLKSGTPNLAPLASGGVALVYSVLDNVLTAKAGENGPTVFTMSLEKNGEGIFTLNAPIDGHGDKVIDFSSLIQAKDFDGDTVSVPTDTFTVTFDGVPFGEGQTLETTEDKSIDGSITAFVGDEGGSFSVTDHPANGVVALNTQTGEFTYTPNANWHGTETFTVTIEDDDGDKSDLIVVTVNVASVNDAPTSTNGSVTTDEDTARFLSVEDFGTYSDVEGTALAAVKITSLESDGMLQYFNGSNWVDVIVDQVVSVADINNNKLRFTPDANESGNPYATIGFKVSDGEDFSEDAYTLTVNVDPDNDGEAPIYISNQTALGQPPKVGDVLQADLGTDPDGAKTGVQYQWMRDGVNIGTDSETYTLTDDDVGTAISVNVTYSDAQGFHESVTSAATAEILPDNAAPTANADNVITNAGAGSTFYVPEWALLANDEDDKGPLDVTGTSNDSDLSTSLVTEPGSVAITDSGNAGGSFDYTVSDGDLTGTGSVTVSQDIVGDLDGTNGNDIVVAGPVTAPQPQITTIGFNAGGYDAGDVVSITVDGVVYSHTVQANARSAENVYDALKAVSMGGITLAASLDAKGVAWADNLTGNAVTLTSDPGAENAFAISANVNNGADVGTPWVTTVDFWNNGDGMFNNATLTITINGTPYSAQDSIYWSYDIDDYLDSAAYSLLSKLNAATGVSASFDSVNNTFTIQTTFASTFTGTSGNEPAREIIQTQTGSSPSDQGNLSVNTTQQASGDTGEPQTTTLSFAASYDAGDVVSVTVDGVVYSHNVLASARTGENVYDALKDVSVSGVTLAAKLEPKGVEWADNLSGNAVTLVSDPGSANGFTISTGVNNDADAGRPWIYSVDFRDNASGMGNGESITIYINGVPYTGNENLSNGYGSDDYFNSAAANLLTKFNGVAGVTINFAPDTNTFTVQTAVGATITAASGASHTPTYSVIQEGSLPTDQAAPGVETINATDAGFVINGLDGDDILISNDGDDFLNGGAGNDILFGGLGFDTLTGGADADTFRFDETAFEDIHVTDVITDYSLTDGDVLDVTALLDSLLGEEVDLDTRMEAIDIREQGGNTFVSVTGEGVTRDIAMLNGVHDVKILYDDKHAPVVHD
ncbi:T1SS-143 repeat domain-containing protein [Rhizobium rhizophilum]|uniref:T1SS-143 repeat domain-containing protein n=1 Tax=Rhizobium rhizophilum TaxID=1850373 RepID=UPI001456281D|nr:DUF5801 repeats-in-toxin domain-containing protein [Rhizobium rhizophilum]